MTTTSNPAPISESSALHFIIGAIPAAIATLTLQVQATEEIVPERHAGILYTACVGLYVMSATIMLVYTVKRVSDHFDARHDATDEMAKERADQTDTAISQVESIVAHSQHADEKHHRSIQGIHSRMETLEKQNAALIKEIAHLRALVIDDEEAQHSHQRTGPRSLS